MSRDSLADDGFWPKALEAIEKKGVVIMADAGVVSQCSVNQCMYNQENMCRAQEIQVAVHADHADCETFSPQ